MSETNGSCDDLILQLEALDIPTIEKQITELEAQAEKLRRLLHVKRGLAPKAKRGRKKNTGSVATKSGPPAP